MTRFSTQEHNHGTETLGPVVIWISVKLGTTTVDLANDVSEEILALLATHGIEGVEIEWREGVVQLMARAG